MFKDERKGEVKKSLNYIQYVQPSEDQEPANLEEFCIQASYAGAETSDNIGKRVAEHNRELEQYLEGKIENVILRFQANLIISL